MKYAILALGLVAIACQKETVDTPALVKPVARFSAPASVNSNIPFQVVNQSTNASTFLWTWGDGTTSTDQAPAHLFDWFGTVRVRLQVTSSGGSDTTSQLVRINPAGPPASVMASAVGRYQGKLHRMIYTGNTYTTTVRDTTLQLTAVNARTVRMLNNEFDYMIGSYRNARPWLGHAPQRNNVMFTSLRHYLQLENPGDSVHFYLYSGGVAQAVATWKFYGKKQP